MDAAIARAAQAGAAGPDLVTLLRGHALRSPASPCLAFGDDQIWFRDMDERSNRVANALLARGAAAGDRIAILAPMAPIFYELFYGCAKAGVTLLPLNWRLSPREIADILSDAAPRLLVIAPEFTPLLAGMTAPVAQLEIADYPGWRDAAADGDPGRPDAIDDPALLLYTSGTTGRPKGAVISHRNLSFVARMAREAWDFTADSVNLVAMPLFHIGGIGYGMMALSQGGNTVLLPQPDPSAVIATIPRFGVTHAFFVPTVIQRLVDHLDSADHIGVDAKATSSLRRILYGASPIGETLLRRAIALFGCEFSHAYGMTETAGTVITLPPADHDPDGPHAARLRSCGKPLPWVELALIDPATGLEVPTGAVGEIRIRSGMVMTGYWNKPAETAAAITPDGWLCTGDAAFRDADGYVYIHDRYKDMIVSGGENIYPTEVENVLQDHPAIAEVAVIGVAHGRWGETPRAYVVASEDGALSEEDVIAFTRLHLARYKCPTSVVIVAALPRTASGKVMKAELRRLAAATEYGA